MGHQQAQAAHGLVTFYNALPAPQTIPAGEMLIGRQNGQVTVPARSQPTQGNIAANDLYGKCCRDNVFVSNDPFHGGESARSYQMVAQQDISAVASSLKASLDQSVQAALSQQVQSNETLVTPVPCSSTVTPDH